MELRYTREYLERLPHGADSYPEHLAKVSTYRDALSSKPIVITGRTRSPSFYPRTSSVPPRAFEESKEVQSGVLPPFLEELIADPPPPSAWIPEVYVNLMFKAVFDLHFASLPDPLTEFHAWVLRQNEQLLAKPLYRVLFRFLTPERLFFGVEHRWTAFRRGTKFDVLERSSTHAIVDLEYASGLYDEPSLLCVGIALRAAATAAGAKNAVLDRHECNDTRARLSFLWEE